MEWLEPCNKHIRNEQKALPALVIFIKAPQDSASDKLANSSTGDVNGLMVRLVALFAQELHAIDEQTVYDRYVVWVVQMVD